MPRKFPEINNNIYLTDEQRSLQKSHAILTMTPKLPSSLEPGRRLQRNLEHMGFGPQFLSFPWTVTSSRPVDKLTQNRTIPVKLQGNAYQRAVHHITEDVVAPIYGTRNLGDKRPPENEKRHKKYFDGEKDSTDGYPIETCKYEEMQDIFWYLCHILDPLRPNKVHIHRFNQEYLLLWRDTKVNWTRILYQALYKCGQQLGGTAPSYMSPFLFHY
jgi:hypothetical protein